jgi:CRISPR-associated endoribonuclease Cas6
MLTPATHTQPHPADQTPPDLYSLIIRLVATQNGKLQAAMGQYANAAFYEILRAVDPIVANEIHTWNGRGPFTISPLLGFGEPKNKQFNIQAGQEGWMRITLLDPALFQTFISYVLNNPGKSTIRLDRIDFQVISILSHPDSHSQARTASIQGLYKYWMEKELTPADYKIHLDFKTPTVFSIREEDPEKRKKRKRRMAMLPNPVDIFGRLADYWDSLQGSMTADHVKEYALDQIVVSRFDLYTTATLIKRNHQSGFKGKISYELFDEWENSPQYVRHLNCLADLAFYSGLGSRTGMGMGQVIRFQMPT